MPFFDLWSRLGFNVDQFLLAHSQDDNYRYPSRCHVFEKDLIECRHGIGQIRARKECQLEQEDLLECVNMFKTLKRLQTIREQRNKLIKEGKYTPPPHHSGKAGTSLSSP